jgi:hypothetical protein
MVGAPSDTSIILKRALKDNSIAVGHRPRVIGSQRLHQRREADRRGRETAHGGDRRGSPDAHHLRFGEREPVAALFDSVVEHHIQPRQ